MDEKKMVEADIRGTINLWRDDNDDILAEILDFWCVSTKENLVDLGLGTIQPDCLRMEWKLMLFPTTDQPWNGVRAKRLMEWAIARQQEWETL